MAMPLFITLSSILTDAESLHVLAHMMGVSPLQQRSTHNDQGIHAEIRLHQICYLVAQFATIETLCTVHRFRVNQLRFVATVCGNGTACV